MTEKGAEEGARAEERAEERAARGAWGVKRASTSSRVRRVE